MAPNKGNTPEEINKIDVYGNPFKTIDSVTKSIKYSANKATNIRKQNLPNKRSGHKEELVLQDNNEPKIQIPLYLAIFGYISYTFLFKTRSPVLGFWLNHAILSGLKMF